VPIELLQRQRLVALSDELGAKAFLQKLLLSINRIMSPNQLNGHENGAADEQRAVLFAVLMDVERKYPCPLTGSGGGGGDDSGGSGVGASGSSGGGGGGGGGDCDCEHHRILKAMEAMQLLYFQPLVYRLVWVPIQAATAVMKNFLDNIAPVISDRPNLMSIPFFIEQAKDLLEQALHVANFVEGKIGKTSLPNRMQPGATKGTVCPTFYILRCVLHCEAASLLHCEAASLLHCEAASLLHCEAASLLHCEAASLLHCEAASLLHSEAASLLHSEAASLLHSEAASLLHSEAASLLHSEAASLLHSEAASLLHSEAASLLHSEAAFLLHSEAASLLHSEAAFLLHSEAALGLGSDMSETASWSWVRIQLATSNSFIPSFTARPLVGLAEYPR
jgi:hypothetical protein